MLDSSIILGITYGGHDSSACLTVGGKLVAACEEERFNRKKHTQEFPTLAINECLKKAGITINDVNEIGFIFDPILIIKEKYLKLALEDERKIQFMINDIERIKKTLNIESTIREKTGFKGKISFHLHHLCHLASSFYVSGFEEALLVSHDGVGEIDCSLIGAGKNNEVSILKKGNRYPDSIGLLYSAITHYLGWKHHSDEGIVMGLAPYGDSKTMIGSSNKTYEQVFKEIIYETDDYHFEIDKSWIEYHLVRDKWISDKFIQTFGPKREPEGSVELHHKHVAAALQDRIEEIILNQLKKAREEFGFKKLCLSGGVFLNCSLNGKIQESKIFDEIFVQPASSDDGAAIGACFLSHKNLKQELKTQRFDDFYLGSSYSNSDIEKSLKAHDVEWKKLDDVFNYTAKKLNEKKIIGWFQGGAEFGPRALGNRSILTSPFPKDMKDFLNTRVKFREEFRPFAPAILNEYTKEYFEIDQESPHMLINARVLDAKINEIPAAIHVDNTARIQTVKPENNTRFRKLLEEFHKETGCPVLLNTSFNIKGQPIVNSPDEAIDCFLGTNIDVLVIGDFVLEK